MKRLVILFIVILQAGCSACSNKGGRSDGGDVDAFDAAYDDAAADETDEVDVPEDGAETASDLVELDAAAEDASDDAEPEVYRPDCVYLDYPAVDLGTLEPTPFTPSREPTDCGEQCRQMSFNDEDLEVADYDVWGNRLVFSNRRIESGEIVESRIYFVNLQDHFYNYISRDSIFEKIPTDSEEKGALGWVALHEDSLVFIRMADHVMPEHIQVDTFKYSISSSNLMLIRTYNYPCLSCSSSYLDLFGDYLVFSDEKEFLAEKISILNIITREECDISTRDWGAGLPIIFGSKVVFREGMSGYGIQVYLYDIEKRTTIQLTKGPGDHYTPNIWGDTVVWSDTRDGGTALSQENADVYMMDLSTGVETPVCTHPASQPHPVAVWGTKIVWPDCRNDPDYPNVPSRALNWDLYMYDLETGRETQLTSMPGRELAPKMYEDKVYFIMKDSAGIYSIFEKTID